MRVVGFFVYCFAGMTAPIGIGFGLIALRAPTFRMIEPNAATEAGVLGDSTAAFVMAYTDNQSARNAAESLVERLPTTTQSSGPGGVRYSSSENGNQGLVRTVGRYVVWLQGPSRELVDSRFAALPSIERNPGHEPCQHGYGR